MYKKKMTLVVLIIVGMLQVFYFPQKENYSNPLSKMSYSYSDYESAFLDQSNDLVTLEIIDTEKPKVCSILENYVLWTILYLTVLLIAPIIIVTLLLLKRKKTVDIKGKLDKALIEQQTREDALKVLGIDFINLIKSGFVLWFLQNLIFIPLTIIIQYALPYREDSDPIIYMRPFIIILNLDLIAGFLCAFGFLFAARSMKDKKQAIWTAILWFSWVGTALTYRIITKLPLGISYETSELNDPIGVAFFTASLSIFFLTFLFSAQLLVKNHLLRNGWILSLFGIINWLIGGLMVLGLIGTFHSYTEAGGWAILWFISFSFQAKIYTTPIFGIVAGLTTFRGIKTTLKKTQLTLVTKQHDLSKLKEVGLSVSEFLEKVEELAGEVFKESMRSYQPKEAALRVLAEKAYDHTFVVFTDKLSETKSMNLAAFAKILKEKPEIDAIIFLGLKQKNIPKLHAIKWKIPPSPKAIYEFELEKLPSIFVLNSKGEEIGKIIKQPEHEPTIEEELVFLLKIAPFIEEAVI